MSVGRSVPYLDLGIQHDRMRTELDDAWHSVLSTSSFVRGALVEEFEDAYAQLHDVAHCIGVANGSDALYLGLRSLGVQPGDEVITTAMSWIATSASISLAGATPVFVDIDPNTYTIDPALIEDAVTSRSRAILPVHLYGHPADMEAIGALSSRLGLAVVEDCAQSHLAEFDGQKLGSLGDVAAVSFYPGKNLGALGDAGAVLTNDARLAAHIRMLANHGSSPNNKHEHPIEGVNSRLDTLQAGFLSKKLAHIQEWTRARQRIARLYSAALAEVGDVRTPSTPSNGVHVFHVYCIRTASRDALREHLRANGVETLIHYPTALPFLGAYADRARGDSTFPIARRYQDEILSLPIYPEMQDDDVEYVAEKIARFYDSK